MSDVGNGSPAASRQRKPCSEQATEALQRAGNGSPTSDVGNGSPTSDVGNRSPAASRPKSQSSGLRGIRIVGQEAGDPERKTTPTATRWLESRRVTSKKSTLDQNDLRGAIRNGSKSGSSTAIDSRSVGQRESSIDSRPVGQRESGKALGHVARGSKSGTLSPTHERLSGGRF